MILAIIWGEAFSRRLHSGLAYPSGAITFMEQRRLSGNILSTYNWGEYLIWHVGRSSKVFIDGRYDTVYPLSVILDDLSFESGDSRAEAAVLRRYPHDFVLTGLDSKAFAFMLADPGWKLIYRDRDSTLFARKDSAAATLPGVPVITNQPSNPYFP